MRNPSIFRVLVLALLFTLTGSVYGANYYLVFDESCMERLEYSYEETRPGNEFVLYSITVGTGEKVLLEVGLESRAPIRSLNTDVLSNCSKAADLFTPNLAEKVNNKVDQIYIVTPVNLGQEYRVATVNSASYYRYDGQNITANTQQYRFEYSMGNLSTVGDLSNGDVRGNVYFIENLPLGPCEVVALRQTYGRENNYLNIYIIPEIGVVEEKSSLANTSFRLSKINNTPFADYVYRRCGSGQTAGVNQEEPQNYSDNDLIARNPYTDQQQQVQTLQPAVVHQVVKGETLFGIGKKYDISVADIKVWNEMSNDIIYPGDQLVVSAPNLPQNFNTDLTPKGQVQEYGTNDLFNNNPSPNGMPAWTQTSGRHVVQNGETVLSIARMYGFTEERFRYFNGLTPTQRVREGEILVTDDCDNPRNTNNQGNSVSSYGDIPANNNGQLNQPNYQYTNDQNTPYQDQYNDFDRNYPDEFQNQDVVNPQQNQQQPNNYDYPPGFTPKAPTGNNTNTANDNFYSPSNYGPVPGRYNNNAPLQEPRNYSYPSQQQNSSNDPTNYNNYLNQRNNAQQRSAVPNSRRAPGTSASPPYGSLPNNYSDNNTLTTKGLPNSYGTSIPLTGIKKLHTVKDGESLESIAAKYGTTVAYLRAINEMDKSEVVIPFQQIYVQK